MPDNISRKSKFCLPNPSTGDYEIHHFETEVNQIEDMSSYMKGISKTINNANSLRTEIGAASVNDISNSNFHLLRQNSKVYAGGDIAFSASLPSSIVLQCTTAGTTAASEPDFSGAVEGGTVTDGTVVWTYKTLVGGGLDREQIPAFNHRDVITTSGTYTAPVTGWYRITVKGGGGGGGSAYGADGFFFSGCGGGEGGTTIAYEYMTAGDIASVVIGAGGAGGANNGSNGENGGDSSVTTVNSNIYTGGGGIGGGGFSGSLKGGAGGTGTIVGCSGGKFDHPSAVTYSATGGTGGGAGGATSEYSSVPANATNGGGGAGGAHAGTGTNYAGSAGGDGYVWFEYFDVSLNP